MDVRLLLCLLLLVSRIGDIATTWLATPTLALEGNPLARRLGWRFILLTLLACLLPYASVELAVAALMPFLLVSAANAGKVWTIRTIGEQEYLAFVMSVVRRSKLGYALLGLLASCSFMALAGVSIILLSPGPFDGYGFWLGAGVIIYAVVVALHSSLFLRRLFRKAATASAAVSGA